MSHQLLNTHLKKEITKQIRTNVYLLHAYKLGERGKREASEPVITSD